MSKGDRTKVRSLFFYINQKRDAKCLRHRVFISPPKVYMFGNENPFKGILKSFEMFRWDIPLSDNRTVPEIPGGTIKKGTSFEIPL